MTTLNTAYLYSRDQQLPTSVRTIANNAYKYGWSMTFLEDVDDLITDFQYYFMVSNGDYSIYFKYDHRGLLLECYTKKHLQRIEDIYAEIRENGNTPIEVSDDLDDIEI